MDDTSVDDIATLTQAIIAGDRDACARFYDDSFDLVYHAALQSTGFNEHDCLDIVQDTFLKAIRFMKRFDSQPALHAWLTRVTRSVCIDAYRARSRRRAREQKVAQHTPQHTEQAPDSTATNWLNTELANLDRDAAELLNLRFRAGMTLAAISDQLGLSTGAVDGRIRRTLATLRKRAIEQGKFSGGLDV